VLSPHSESDEDYLSWGVAPVPGKQLRRSTLTPSGLRSSILVRRSTTVVRNVGGYLPVGTA